MNFNSNPSIGSSGDFLKLKDKQTISGVFRGEVLEYYCKWDGKKSVKCDPTDKDSRFRFRVNFIVNENGVLKSYIWEQGPTVYNSLKSVNADYKLESYFMKITRHGSTMNDTEYMIMPVPNGALSPEKEKIIASIQLQDLKSGLGEAQTLSPSSSIEQTEEQLPF